MKNKTKRIYILPEESLAEQKAKKKLSQIVFYIESCLPAAKRVSDKEMIESFEKIESYMHGQKLMKGKIKYAITLYGVASYMKISKDIMTDKFDSFFNNVHAIIRRKAEKHQSYKHNLFTINESNFTKPSKILNPKYYKYYSGCNGISMNYDEAHAAYQKVLDLYDPNVSKKTFGMNWSGFWSLISTENGEIEGCYLGDTEDVEMFYENLKQIQSKKKVKNPFGEKIKARCYGKN